MAATGATAPDRFPIRYRVRLEGLASDRLLSLALCVMLHAAALAALARLAPAPVTQDPVIKMELVPPQAPRPEPARSTPQPVPPAPVVSRPAASPTAQAPVPTSTSLPVLAAPAADAPPEQSVPAQPPAIREMVLSQPVREPSVPATPAAPREAPVIPPSFDAAYLDNPAPRYPPAALRLRESGRVLLSVMVSATGQPERVELARSSGSSRLDQAALETVRRWRFVPARQGERSVAAQVTVPLVFRLDE